MRIDCEIAAHFCEMLRVVEIEKNIEKSLKKGLLQIPAKSNLNQNSSIKCCEL